MIEPDIPVILTSGFSQDEELAELMELGLKGFLQKPYHGPALSRIIAENLKH